MSDHSGSGSRSPSLSDTEVNKFLGRQTPSSSRVQETAEHTPSGTQESTPEGTPLAHRRQLPEGYSYLVDASGAIIMTPEGKEDLKDYFIDTLYHDFPVPTPGDRFGREYMLLRMREYLKHRRDDVRRATQRPDWFDREEWRQIREERITAPDRWKQQRRAARARIDAGSLHHLGSGGWDSFDEDFQGTTGRAASRLERSLGAQHGLAWMIELLDRRGGEFPYTEPLTRAELPDPPQLNAYKVTTKQTPFKLAFGQEAIVPFEFTLPALRTSIAYGIDPQTNLHEKLIELEKMDEQRQRALWEQQVAQSKMKAYQDRRLKAGKMKEGDLVLCYPGKMDAMLMSLTVGWSRPYIIFRMFENGSVKLKDLQGMLLPDRVNRGKLKRYHPRDSGTQEGVQHGPDSHLGSQGEMGNNFQIKLQIRNTRHRGGFNSHLLPTIPEEQEGTSKDYPEIQEKIESTQPPGQRGFPGNQEGDELQRSFLGNQERVENPAFQGKEPQESSPGNQERREA
ncbi:hypothetical protein L7F22_064253 [Adiantum nelumboides]|nr:hypothetical protein [Adiantum nelumboides]